MIVPSGATARLSDGGSPICGVFVTTRTVRSSTTSMLLIVRRSVAAADASELGAICRCRLNFTSFAVSLSPLWNFCPGRRWKVQVRPSSSASSQRSSDAGPGAALVQIETDQGNR